MAASDASSSATKTSAKLAGDLKKQRRKSRDLEQEVFGMDMNDMDKLTKAFKEVDADGSGKIDITELRELLKKVGYNPTEEQMKTLLKTYDTNNDKVIDFDEFRKMIADWNDLFKAGKSLGVDGAPAPC